ncbi:MAG: hypothetical protein IT438_12880 [Phycisphaerales bacterium]|nr:hypothetical protein [Phycisphaerales bacterium]
MIAFSAQVSGDRTDYVEVETGYGGKHRKVRVVPGNTYRIEPLSPQVRKNRDRVCRVTGFREFGAKGDLYANVVWEDTGQKGWSPMDHFAEVKPGAC